MDCAHCPIALQCHGGRLQDFLLCPACGKLQIILSKSYPMTYYYEGEPNKPQQFWTPDNIETLYLECDERYLDEDQYIDFQQECDNEHYHTHGREPVNYTASILIPDPGPHQHAPRRGTANMLLVKYCNECYAKKLTRDLP